MAKSGRFTTQVRTNLYLYLDWKVLSQDIPNNRSRVELKLIIAQTGTGMWFGSNKTGSLQGSSFTYTGGYNGTGNKTLRTREIWVNHNSNGSKSQTFSGSFNLNITYSGSYIGTISVSGTANLDTIPRASSIDSFSIGGSLRPSTANSVQLKLTRATTSFTHDIQLRIGSTTIATWNGQNVPSSLSLSASQVNALLSRMSTVESATVTLRVQTKSGSTNIGSVVTRNATARVSSTVVPAISGLSTSIAGSGHDKTINKYVQGISKVNASFTSSAKGGSSIKSNVIKVSTTNYTGNSITTHTMSKSGTLDVIATVTDSRGRTASQKTTISVHAYNPPRISNFQVQRIPNTGNADVSRAGNWSNLSGDNKLTVLVQQRVKGNSTWTNLENRSIATGNVSGGISAVNLSDTRSYEFRFTLKDQFGMTTIAETDVGTAIVTMSRSPFGISTGKTWEHSEYEENGATLQIAEGATIDGHKVVFFTEYEEW